MAGTMKLIHYSDHPEIAPMSYLQMPYYMKPNGLWVSDENGYGWSDWCTDADFRDISKQKAHQIELCENANILLINDASGLKSFTDKYCSEKSTCRGFDIDWIKVANDWQGIIITPYLRECRFTEGFFWYYGWDCASGCIWDFSAIKSIGLEQ